MSDPQLVAEHHDHGVYVWQCPTCARVKRSPFRLECHTGHVATMRQLPDSEAPADSADIDYLEI